MANLAAFREYEIARTTQAYGNIARVFSTYEARRDLTDAKPTLVLREFHCSSTASGVGDFDPVGQRARRPFLPPPHAIGHATDLHAMPRRWH